MHYEEFNKLAEINSHLKQNDIHLQVSRLPIKLKHLNFINKLKIQILYPILEKL